MTGHVTTVGIAAAVGMVLLAGCSNEPPNTDPRHGRVVLDSSNCWTGGCYTDWKACAGPDLIVFVGHEKYVVKASPECEETR